MLMSGGEVRCESGAMKKTYPAHNEVDAKSFRDRCIPSQQISELQGHSNMFVSCILPGYTRANVGVSTYAVTVTRMMNSMDSPS